MTAVPSTPKPYTTERRKLIWLASAKYRVGHEISPMRMPNASACTSIWLSNTKSSEFCAQRQRLEHAARERAIAGVEFRQLRAEQQVLQRGQHAVRDVLVARHAAGERGVAEDARADHDVVDVRRDHRRHRGDQPRLVLVIGMQHDDDVGAPSSASA